MPILGKTSKSQDRILTLGFYLYGFRTIAILELVVSVTFEIRPADLYKRGKFEENLDVT